MKEFIFTNNVLLLINHEEDGYSVSGVGDSFEPFHETYPTFEELLKDMGWWLKAQTENDYEVADLVNYLASVDEDGLPIQLITYLINNY